MWKWKWPPPGILSSGENKRINLEYCATPLIQAFSRTSMRKVHFGRVLKIDNKCQPFLRGNLHCGCDPKRNNLLARCVHFNNISWPLLLGTADTFFIINFAQPLLWGFKEERKYQWQDLYSRSCFHHMPRQRHFFALWKPPTHSLQKITVTVFSGFSRLVPIHQVISGEGNPPIAWKFQ